MQSKNSPALRAKRTGTRQPLRFAVFQGCARYRWSDRADRPGCTGASLFCQRAWKKSTGMAAGIRLERRVVRIIGGKPGTHGNWKAIVLFLCTEPSWLFQKRRLRPQLLIFPLQLLQTSAFRNTQLTIGPAVSFTVFLEPVTQSFRPNTLSLSDLPNRFRRGNHLLA